MFTAPGCYIIRMLDQRYLSKEDTIWFTGIELEVSVSKECDTITFERNGEQIFHVTHPNDLERLRDMIDHALKNVTI